MISPLLIGVAVASFALGRVTKRAGGGSSTADQQAPHSEVDYNQLALQFANTGHYWAKSLSGGDEEQGVYWSMRQALDEHFEDDPFPLFTQVSLGSFVGLNKDYKSLSRQERTFLAKRPDFVIVSRAFKPIIIVEYQGGGHEFGITDDIKQVMADRLGIRLMEMYPHKDRRIAIEAIKQELERFKTLGANAYADSIRQEAIQKRSNVVPRLRGN